MDRLRPRSGAVSPDKAICTTTPQTHLTTGPDSAAQRLRRGAIGLASYNEVASSGISPASIFSQIRFVPDVPRTDGGCVPGQDRENVWRAFAEANSQNVFRPRGLLGIVICPADYPVHKRPLLHEGGSEAQYYVDGHIIGPHVLFMYYLPPQSKTSEHWHVDPAIKGEDYKLFYGRAYIAGRLAVGDSVHTEPGEDHQVTTGESGAFVAALLLNAAGVEPGLWHDRTPPARRN